MLINSKLQWPDWIIPAAWQSSLLPALAFVYLFPSPNYTFLEMKVGKSYSVKRDVKPQEGSKQLCMLMLDMRFSVSEDDTFSPVAKVPVSRSVCIWEK